MHDVFISYSRKDRAFVEGVVQHLSKAEFTCWLDTKDLQPAEVWRSELKDAIIDADNVIFVISPDSIDSAYCKMELDFSVDHNKRIIPLMYRPLNGNQNLPDSLAERQWLQIDFKHDQARSALVQVIRNDQKWRNQSTDYLRRAENWRSEKGGVLARVELEAARAWLEKGAKMDPGPSELHIRYIHESEAYHLQEAERWKNLYSNALARQLAAQAEVMIGQGGVLLETATLLALESMHRFPTLAGDRALRKALCLLPKKVADIDCAKSGEVQHAAFSVDGQYLATFGSDNVVRVWECLTGRAVSHFNVPGCRKLIFSPTQAHVITIAEVATVWDMNQGTELFCLRHEGLADIGYATDGQFIATVGGDRSTRIWDTSDHQEFVRYVNSAQMRHVAIAPGAAEVIAWNETIAEVFRSPGQPAHTIQLGGSFGVTFEYSPDGQRLSQVASSDYCASLFDVATREQLIFEDRHWHAAFSANGEHYALASPEWDAQVYYLPSCWKAGHYFAPSAGGMMVRKDVRGRVSCRRGNSVHHDNSIYKVALSRNGEYLGTTSRDGTARVWEPYRGREVLRLLEEVEGHISQLAFHASERFVTGWGGKVGRTWEAAGHRQAAALSHHDGVFDVSFSGDGHLAATVSQDGTCRVWEIPSGNELARFEVGSGFGRHTVALNRDGKKLLLDGRDIFDVASQKLIGKTPQVEGSGPRAVSGNWAVVTLVRPDNSVAVLDLETGKERAREAPSGEKVKQLAVSADGNAIAIVEEKGAVRIWRWKTGEGFIDIAANNVRSASYGASGSQIALLGDTDEGLVEVWDTNEMRSVQRLQHEGKVMSASLDPSESYVVTASDDRAARIWQLATGEQVAQFEHDADVWAAEFSPDGKYVLSAGGRSDRTARLWLWRPRDLIAEACSRLSRDLKPEEWNQYLGAETYRPTRQWNEEELK